MPSAPGSGPGSAGDCRGACSGGARLPRRGARAAVRAQRGSGTPGPGEGGTAFPPLTLACSGSRSARHTDCRLLNLNPHYPTCKLSAATGERSSRSWATGLELYLPAGAQRRPGWSSVRAPPARPGRGRPPSALRVGGRRLSVVPRGSSCPPATNENKKATPGRELWDFFSAPPRRGTRVLGAPGAGARCPPAGRPGPQPPGSLLGLPAPPSPCRRLSRAVG